MKTLNSFIFFLVTLTAGTLSGNLALAQTAAPSGSSATSGAASGATSGPQPAAPTGINVQSFQSNTASEYNQLPPEVQKLLPQPPAQVAPANVQTTGQPSAEPPAAAPEAFPTSQMPQVQPNRTEERHVPSEVVSVLPPILKSADVRAVLRTSIGDITIKLDRARAPETVAHFIGLARGEKEFIDVKTSKRAKRPFYNGLIFHRVTKGYLIQTGCPFGNGKGGPGDIATIKDEIKPNMTFSRPGLVAMAPLRDATGLTNVKDTNGSQFFISLREMPSWDDQYTIFGEVEDGMDVVQKISGVKVGPTERPIKRIYLVAVDIIEGNGK